MRSPINQSSRNGAGSGDKVVRACVRASQTGVRLQACVFGFLRVCVCEKM